MTPEETQQLELSLLIALQSHGEIGCLEERLFSGAQAASSKFLSEPELTGALRELAARGWVSRYQPALAPRRWRITPKGLIVLQDQGLA